MIRHAFAQVDDLGFEEPEDIILQIVVDNSATLSGGILGVRYKSAYYLPAVELAELFEFAVDYDEGRKYLTGWYLDPQNAFSIDAQGMEIVGNNEVNTLGPDEVLGDDIAPFLDELYVQVETLNSIWPLMMSVDLSTLSLVVETEIDLPFKLKAEREKRRKKLTGKVREEIDVSKLPLIENPYQLLGRPAIDLQAESRIDGEANRQSLNITGVQDVLGTTLDFGTTLEHEDGDFKRPDELRLRLRRVALGDEEYIGGIKEFRAGDVRLQQRDLVSSSASGRGIVATTTPFREQGEFDSVTIEGIAPAGWEIELYRNTELLEFGIVGEDGLYRFEDVALFFGNNEIRAVLFGPQGQVREDVYTYNFTGDAVEPGETEYYLGAVDTNEDFIDIKKDDRIEPEGLTATGYAFHGLNRMTTLFAGGSQIVSLQEEDPLQYLSAGASVSTPIGPLRLEAFKQAGGGEALSSRFITRFLGTNVTLRGDVFNDFESPDAGFGESRKKFETEIEAQKNIRLSFGTVGLNVNVEHSETENRNRNTRATTQQSLSWRGLRLSNRTATQVNNDDHLSTSGQINATYRVRRWRFRPALNYSYFPQGRIDSISGSANYKVANDYSLDFRAAHQFEAGTTTAGMTFSKEFDRFLGSVAGDWDSEDGLTVAFRASASLGPYGNERDYIVYRNKLSSVSPVQARIFLDRDNDGKFDENIDDPIPDAKLTVAGRRSLEQTDEDGRLVMFQNQAYRNVVASIDESSVDDPYYKTVLDGFAIQPRPASMPSIELPMIETGAIDGSVFYDETNNPVEGLILELVNEKGEVIQTSETAFDGFYTFEFVPPGSYTVRADPDYGVDIPPQTVVVNADELYYSGIDLLLYSNDPTTIGDDWDGSGFGPYLPGQEPTGDPMGPTLPFDEDLMGPFMPATKPDEDDQAAGPVMPQNVPSGSPAPKPGDDNMKAFVKRVRIGEHPTMVRLVLDLSGPIDYSPMETQDGRMVVVDLPHTAWDAIEEWNGSNTPILSSFDVSAMPDGGTRLTMAAKSFMKIKSSGVLPPSESGGFRLFIDLFNPNNE
ncbi:MAG: SdrD B-like domain-containing protein [Pseudomonadota bacterium]